MGLVLLVGSYFFWGNTPNQSGDRITVVTSFYPLYYFTREIAGDGVEVVNLVPAGAEPHDFEPGTQDIARIAKSRLLVVNGAGFEPWAESIPGGLPNNQTRIIFVAEGLVQNTDPHVWLDPVLAQEEVKIITRALGEVDPAHQVSYQANGLKLSQKLAALDRDFRVGLANCQHKQAVTSHAAFGYLAARYGFVQVPLAGLSPEDEPSPRQLADLVDVVKKDRIKYVFFETLVSPRLSQTLAAEAGVRTLAFDPVEGLTEEDQRAGADYFSLQKQNLANLRLALECN